VVGSASGVVFRDEFPGNHFSSSAGKGGGVAGIHVDNVTR
jgi:hypothetical protein